MSYGSTCFGFWFQGTTVSHGREAEQQADSRQWLRDHSSNRKHEAERTWKGRGLGTPKACPQWRTSCWTSPNNITNWGPSAEMPKPVGVITHSNNHRNHQLHPCCDEPCHVWLRTDRALGRVEVLVTRTGKFQQGGESLIGVNLIETGRRLLMTLEREPWLKWEVKT